MKKIIITSLSLLLILGISTGCGCKKKESKSDNNEETKSVITENKNEDIIKEQEVDGIKMTDTSMITKDGETIITIKVTNNTGSDYKLNGYNIIVKDKEGNVLIKLPGYLGSTIKNGETKELKSTTNADLRNASAIEYEVKK
jgi:thioredoxin-related protein